MLPHDLVSNFGLLGIPDTVEAEFWQFVKVNNEEIVRDYRLHAAYGGFAQLLQGLALQDGYSRDLFNFLGLRSGSPGAAV